MEFEWKESIDQFIFLANKNAVRMVMVGGGAVNFHGYQRHSADVDFWIETSHSNLSSLVSVFTEMGYEIEQFPDTVKDQLQNISVKFSPADLDLELITRFEIGKSFNEAFEEAISVEISGNQVLRWKVLSLDDLLESKRRAARPKDFLDIQQLKSLNK
ncbi:nucleotidyltransferase [Algoriphagus aquimarinus]|uniref:nucleotidyltransferase n=1 Tax=Algoriphagus aquimarinus TaxID=237018 RepID=UPI0030DB6DF1|tara:strand:+ start:3803 stop:4276 length:474 start_codon:yes stop_codon:yes gene_type:complete